MSKALTSRIERLASLLSDEPGVTITIAPWAVPRPASDPAVSVPPSAPVPAPEPDEPEARCPECGSQSRTYQGQPACVACGWIARSR